MGPASRSLIHPLVHTLIDIAGSGNRVIAAYIGELVHTVIMFARPRNLTAVIADVLDGGSGGFKTPSPACREACAECLRTALETYPTAELQKHEDDMLALALRLVTDASEAARNTGRICIAVHRFHFRGATEAQLKRMQPRDAKALHELPEWQDPNRLVDTVAPVHCTGERSSEALGSTGKSLSATASTVATPSATGASQHWEPVDGHVAGGGEADTRPTDTQHASLDDVSPTSLQLGRTQSADSSSLRSARGSSSFGDDSEVENCPDKNGHVLQVGDAVRLYLPPSHGGDAPTRKFALAWIQWMGFPSFAEGMWCGLQLEHQTGKHDGRVKGHRYFSCPAGCGVFVRPKYLAIDVSGAPAQNASSAVERSVQSAPVIGSPPKPKRGAPAATIPVVADMQGALVPSAVQPAEATLPELLAECRAHMDNMLQVLKTEFTTASALASTEEEGRSGDKESVDAAVRVMLGAVQERLALDKMWFVRLTALQLGAAASDE